MGNFPADSSGPTAAPCTQATVDHSIDSCYAEVFESGP